MKITIVTPPVPQKTATISELTGTDMAYLRLALEELARQYTNRGDASDARYVNKLHQELCVNGI